MPPADARLWAKVIKEPDPDGCWIWTGYACNGYGRVCRSTGGRSATYPVHRIIYEDARGPVPAGLVLDHLCRVTRCVRPSHLEPVSQLTNIARGESFAAVNAQKASCPAGHVYSPGNTYLIPSTGGRMCRACKRAGRATERLRRRERAQNGSGPGSPGRPAHTT